MLRLRERDRFSSELFGHTPAAVASARQSQTQRLGSILALIHAPIVAPRRQSIQTGNGEHLRLKKEARKEIFVGNDTNNGELTCAPNESYHDG